jgi:hypothetical protein
VASDFNTSLTKRAISRSKDEVSPVVKRYLHLVLHHMQCIHSWQWSGGRSIGRLPVVVWIHGGGQVAYEMFPLVIKYFWYGYYIARASCYDGADLVIQSNHGVVAIAVYSVCLRCTLFDPQMYSPLTRFPCRRAWKVGYYRMTQICVYLAEAGRVCSPTRPAWRRPTILLYFVS